MSPRAYAKSPMRQVPYFAVGWDSLKPGSTPLSPSLLSGTLPSSQHPSPLLHFLRSQASSWIPSANRVPNWRDHLRHIEAAYLFPSGRHHQSSSGVRASSRRALEGQKFGQLDLAPLNPPCNACSLSGRCNHAFKVNKNHHRRTSDTWVPSSRLPSRHRTRPSRPLATGDRHISTNIVPLPLPAIASPASSPTTIPQFVLFAGPDQHPPPTRPCRMNNRLDPVVDIPRRSLGSAVRRNQRNDGQDERAIGFGTQKASHRS